jgi:hypothetical protein
MEKNCSCKLRVSEKGRLVEVILSLIPLENKTYFAFDAVSFKCSIGLARYRLPFVIA